MRIISSFILSAIAAIITEAVFALHSLSFSAEPYIIALRIIVLFCISYSLISFYSKADRTQQENFFGFVNLILVTVYIMMMFYFYKDFGRENTAEIPSQQETVKAVNEPAPETGESDIAEIKINPLTEYNNMTKEQIYELRKQHVQNSMFKSENYAPSEFVFGAIETGRPWKSMSSTICTVGDTAEAKTAGVSEESRFINNPSLLYMVENYMNYRDPELDICKSKALKFIPEKSFYNRKTNTITVIFPYDRYLPEFEYIILNGLNAKDLGYNYVAVRSFENITFNKGTRLLSDCSEPQNMLHVGGSCGLEGGCNNGSPFQPDFVFFIKGQNASMNLALWKDRPNNPKTDKPDINYVIEFK